MKKLFAVILAIVLVIALAACGQDKPEEVAVSTTPAGDTYVINGEEQTIYPYYAIEENYVTDMVNMGYLEFEIYNIYVPKTYPVYNVGTVMLTYLLYNPDTSYEDDILERYDYILDDRFEER